MRYTPAKPRTHVRWVWPRDYAAVVAIERASFFRPWTEDQLRLALRQPGVVGLVAERPPPGRLHGPVAGYVVYRLANLSIEVLNLAVAEEYRRQDVAAGLVDTLKAKLSPRRRVKLFALVNEWLTGAHRFFHSQGFRATRVLPGYYPCGEDAYRFVYRL